MFLSRPFILIGWSALLGCIAGCSATMEEKSSPTATGGSGGTTSGTSMTSGSAGSSTVTMTTTTTGSSGGSSGAAGSGGAAGLSGSGGSGGGSAGAVAVDASGGARDANPDVAIQDSGSDARTSDATMPSMGCGNAAGQALASYVVKNTMSGGVARTYSLYRPPGYDPMRAYPLVILAHGCNGAGATPFPLETASRTEAIVVALKSVAECFVYEPTGADVVYFDTVLAEVSASHCVDRSRVFMAGFSSGSYLTYTVGCVRAGIVRAQGNAAGAQVRLPTCAGPVAALIAHDSDDMDNLIAGGIAARDRILMTNGCTTQTLPYDFDGDAATPSTCVMYQGCRAGYPVVWCPTTGKGHSNQVPITTVGLWRFWSQL
jgi:polyhydroxybutyrate depolymerase